MDYQTINERDYSYPQQIEVAMYDGNGAFYPAAYQKLMTRAAEKHLENIELDVPRMMRRYGVSWVLLSLSLELRRPLSVTEQLTVRTWATEQHPPIYRREVALYDEKDEMVGAGTTFSTVLDLRTRHICTDRGVLDTIRLPEGEKLLEASSRYTEKPAFTEVERRTARPSWQDGLGHVNNGRYGEIVYDALTVEERRALKQLKRLDIWFLAEMRPGQTFSVQRAEGTDSVTVKGVLLPEDKPSFVMRLGY